MYNGHHALRRSLPTNPNMQLDKGDMCMKGVGGRGGERGAGVVGERGWGGEGYSPEAAPKNTPLGWPTSCSTAMRCLPLLLLVTTIHTLPVPNGQQLKW